MTARTSLFIIGPMRKTLLSRNLIRPALAKFLLPRHALFAQYSSEQDSGGSKFYCPPGSEEFCIAGHMPGYEQASGNEQNEGSTISNHIDSCVVGPNSKVKPKPKRIIPCLASVEQPTSKDKRTLENIKEN